MSGNEKNEIEEKEEKNEETLQRKLTYKRRSPGKPNEVEKKDPIGLTPEDLALLRELAPRLSPKGRQMINLVLIVFDQERKADLNQLLQIISPYVGGSPSTPSSSLMELLPLLSSLAGNGNPGQSGGINPAALAGLFSLLLGKAHD